MADNDDIDDSNVGSHEGHRIAIGNLEKTLLPKTSAKKSPTLVVYKYGFPINRDIDHVRMGQRLKRRHMIPP